MFHCSGEKEEEKGVGEQNGLISGVAMCLVGVLLVVLSEVELIQGKKTTDGNPTFLHKSSSLRSCVEETEMELLLWEERVRKLVVKRLQDSKEAEEVLHGADDCLQNIEELLLSIVHHFGIEISRVQMSWLDAKSRKEIAKNVTKSRKRWKLQRLVEDMNDMYFEDIRLFRNQLHAFGTLLQKIVYN
jgi:hypothetical protein